MTKATSATEALQMVIRRIGDDTDPELWISMLKDVGWCLVPTSISSGEVIAGGEMVNVTAGLPEGIIAVRR